MDTPLLITTFSLIDTAVINLDHQTDVCRCTPDSEVVTGALVVVKYFANHHRIALNVTQQLQYFSGLTIV